DASSAIVHGNGRTFTCRLSVAPFHLCDHPSQNGYKVEMSQVQNISGEELKPHVIIPKASVQALTSPEETMSESAPIPLPDYTRLTATPLSESSLLDIPETQPTSLDDTDDVYASLMAPLSEKELDTFPEESLPERARSIPVPAVAVQPPILGNPQYTADEKRYLAHHKIDNTYHYDPHVAAKELGLPVDLIQEFIGDFIQQSYEFKNELFQAAVKSDFNTLHILSHKLKGVAANLRVENAFETLTIINVSTESVEIEANLKYFYSIIAKLEGKKIPEIPILEETSATTKSEPSSAIESEVHEDIYAFSPKQHHNEPLLIHEEDIYNEEEILSNVPKNNEPLKEERLALHKEITNNVPSAEDTEESIVVPLHYDMHSVAGSLGIEPSFMEELINDYKTDAQSISTQIIQAIKAFDTHTWRSSAAKLKGISDNLRLSEISQELTILSTTNDAQEAKRASLRLSSYLDQL
ncbi:MAG: hypothetical protein Q8K81_02290, partial [Sulfuricurvum sp.]|nr:hypothetical protein [Sulfuricurvum sp.]